MNVIRWIHSRISHRGKALAEYRSGMIKANKHNYTGAIDNYSAVIENSDTPDDVKSMAIYNRALAYSAIDQDENAAKDLEAVLKQPGLSKEIRTAVLRRRERVQQRADRELNKESASD